MKSKSFLKIKFVGLTFLLLIFTCCLLVNNVEAKEHVCQIGKIIYGGAGNENVYFKGLILSGAIRSITVVFAYVDRKNLCFVPLLVLDLPQQIKIGDRKFWIRGYDVTQNTIQISGKP